MTDYSGARPPIIPRPTDGNPLSRAESSLMRPDSVSTKWITGLVAPVNAPMTPEETDRMRAHLHT